ncbi:MAG: alpha/beta fold hydrolase [Chloroflexi bacterium]|nr:alpha/beta fold hydrolase [Chloroflexota bacterium]
MLFENAFAGAEHQPFLLRAGNGAAALLVHGFPGTPAEMRPLGEALHAAGWTARGLLLPGFGSDIGSIDRRRFEDWQGAVIKAAGELRRSHNRLLLIGNSMGGALAISAAAACSADGLVLLNPFWELESPLWKLLPVLSRVFRQIKPFGLVRMNFDDRETREGILKFMPDADLDDPQVQQAIREFAIPTGIFAQIRRAGLAGHKAAAALAERKIPALVLQGDGDELVKPIKTRALAARLGATYRELPGAHDLPDPRSAGWATVRATVLEFAATLPQAQGANHV